MRSTFIDAQAAKSKAKAIASRLQSLGHPITHGQALETLAASEGFPDWNTMAASAAAPEPFDLTLGYYHPGDGGSVAWRMHALNLVERFPQHTVVMAFPFHYPEQNKAQAWRDRTLRVEVSMAQLEANAFSWPSVGQTRGKIITVMPPQNETRDNEHLGRWLMALERSQARWKAQKLVKAWFFIDIHRYPQGITHQMFSQKSWDADVHLFSMDLTNALTLDQPRLRVLTLRRTLHGTKWDILQSLRCQWTVMPDSPMEVSEAALERMDGWFRLLGPALRLELQVKGRCTTFSRCLAILEEESQEFASRRKAQEELIG